LPRPPSRKLAIEHVRPSQGPRLRIGRGIAAASIILAAFAITSCTNRAPKAAANQPVTIQYWEKWTNFEAEAMQAVVDKYNKSQNRIRVVYLSTAQIDRKLLLATAGGTPPDVAGFWNNRMVPYAEMGALKPLDRLMKRDGISPDDYLPVIDEQCTYRGFHFGMPATPATVALHYNKKLFREAGLDPERPPQTIAELDEYAQKLTKVDKDGNIIQLGFNPMDPGWWNDHWGRWFGGTAWDGVSRITADSPENIATYRWLTSYPKRYGSDALVRFTGDPSGNFASSQNLFIAGKLAMQLQGVWMANFINQYNPKLEWGAAPFPAARDGLKNVTICECDILVIPQGSRHPEEAWDFIKFVQRQENMELLCLGQKKFSPLRKVSDTFYVGHPNPYIKVFRELAESKNAYGSPKLPIYSEYADELRPATDLTWRLLESPETALRRVTERIQPRLDNTLAQWNRAAATRLQEWSSQ
jgi:multiple sugar transport system substrate-binding protein